MSNVGLGRLGITIGLVAAVMGALGTAIGMIRNRPAMVQSSRTYAWAVFAGAVTAVIAMERALITRDFTVKYVAEHGSSKTPPLFNVATMWSALEGSILLWVILLSGYLASVAWRFRKRVDDHLVGWALVTMFGIATFFFLLLMGPANPFVATQVPPGFDGPSP
ncbi:MAG: heme lyase CcmF/NrfE family subunit, partial [Candidatus Microthrix parvicella]